jgi:hypothetical protein
MLSRGVGPGIVALMLVLGGAMASCSSSGSGAGDVCSGDGCSAEVPDATPDAPPDAIVDGDAAEVPEVAADVDLPEIVGDVVVGDDASPTDVPGDVPIAMVDREFSFWAICGVSMGAAAMTVAGHSFARGGPEFDVIGAMGGYIDYRYMGHVVRDLLMGGFCKMQDILDRIDGINDPTTPGLECGPVRATQPYEWDWGFNQMHYNNNGGNWKREFYLDVIGSFAYAFGNLLYYNPENKLLPPGVPYEWMKNTTAQDKCATPYVIPKKSKDSYNAEYNPNGDYDLVTVCDGDTRVGCKDGDPNKCDEANPDYRLLAGQYNPALPHNVPYPFLLAVDYNGNGRRDYAEPIVVNAMERFLDVGLDGCTNEFEDGLGGCLAVAVANPVGDPNNDDFDLMNNPLGTQGNHEYDDANGRQEPYEDFGIDGVKDTLDFGEADGQYTMSPGMKALLEQDIRSYFMSAPEEQLRKHTWYFDGGIRDALHSINSNTNAIARLRARNQEVKIYDDFTSTSNAIIPNGNLNELATDLSIVDFSPAKFGRNAMVRYGDPDATADEIEAGNGGHVGAGAEVVLRVTMFFGMAFNRMPGVYTSEDFTGMEPIWTSYYSEALKGRRWYVVALPPGYDDPANKDRKYPAGILMPGIGMPLDSMAATTAIFNLLQSNGRMPHFITLLPDGQCSYRRKSDGKRVTGCVRSPAGGMDCVDDECKGPHESCTVTHLSNRDSMDQECNSGHFFVNHQTNIWADPDAAPTMKYEDSLFEVVDIVNKNYRVMDKGTFKVPADW